jgi:hypothetical protein
MMMYFVVCSDSTYHNFFDEDIYAIKLECLTQLQGLRPPIVKFFEEDFTHSDADWSVQLEALATVGAIHLTYCETWSGEIQEDNFYPTRMQ